MNKTMDALSIVDRQTIYYEISVCSFYLFIYLLFLFLYIMLTMLNIIVKISIVTKIIKF